MTQTRVFSPATIPRDLTAGMVVFWWPFDFHPGAATIGLASIALLVFWGRSVSVSQHYVNVDVQALCCLALEAEGLVKPGTQVDAGELPRFEA